ncbi:hypothetical protein BGZ75_009350 [Mortierella antarctica]|nr:hypothetical protein BGZ75_009350 [Mortierella antarctica]
MMILTQNGTNSCSPKRHLRSLLDLGRLQNYFGFWGQNCKDTRCGDKEMPRYLFRPYRKHQKRFPQARRRHSNIDKFNFPVRRIDVFATAARDGAVLIWDIRCSGTTSAQGDTVYRPANRLVNVHANTTRPIPPKKSKHGSDGPNTASAVQYMKHNEHIIASTGALDGSVKYWDVRKHGSYFKHDYPKPLQTSSYTPLTKRAHGMTSMALSPDGSALYAVSSDNHIYMYNTTALCGPVERFGGSNFTCPSYYIKISVSPDGNYIAAGSSKDLYVWEVNRPDKKPLIFHGHEREVTGVDWAKDLGNGTQLSGCSDDATVRTWKSNGDLVQECLRDQSLQNLHGMVSE